MSRPRRRAQPVQSLSEDGPQRKIAVACDDTQHTLYALDW